MGFLNMAKRSCPFCYVKIDTRKPWFRCTGRPAPGRTSCQPQWDERREQAIGIKEMALPSFPGPTGLRVAAAAPCPHCGMDSKLKVCPNCHSRLPAGFGDSESPLIAVVGARHTGKSVYLKVLAHHLRHGLGGRFGADVRLYGDAQFQAETGGGQDFLDPAGGLFPDGALYQRTQQAPNGRREPIVFAWRQRRAITGYDTTFLSFFDTAGEDLQVQDTVDNLGYLGAADALILLLDPFMIAQARDRIRLPASAVDTQAATIDVVSRVTENLRLSHRLGGRRNISIPVAVAFAKIDAFFDLLGPDHPLVRRPESGAYYDEQAGLATHEHVRALLHDWGASDIDIHLVHNYKRFRYFTVSALGAEPDYDNNKVDVRGVRPFRVDEPLLWLLSEFNVVPRRRAAR